MVHMYIPGPSRGSYIHNCGVYVYTTRIHGPFGLWVQDSRIRCSYVAFWVGGMDRPKKPADQHNQHAREGNTHAYKFFQDPLTVGLKP